MSYVDHLILLIERFINEYDGTSIGCSVKNTLCGYYDGSCTVADICDRADIPYDSSEDAVFQHYRR